MNGMTYAQCILKGLECCGSKEHCHYGEDGCPFFFPENPDDCTSRLARAALDLLREQEPRVMTLEEVIVLPYGYVLIETDKEGSLRWVDALLFCKNTNFSFDFITLEGRARLLGAEYNKEWRCWTNKPTETQRMGAAWDANGP